MWLKAQHVALIDSPNEKPDRQRTRQVEPEGLVKARLEREAIGCSSVVPYAVVVGSNHAERVLSGRQRGIISRATRAGIHPVPVIPFKLVFEAYPVGDQQAQRGIVKFQISAAGGKMSSLLSRDPFALHQHFVNIDRRGAQHRPRIFSHQYSHPSGRREPKFFRTFSPSRTFSPLPVSPL